MKLRNVPVNLYRKFFIILLCVFAGLFVLEFVTAMLGVPLTELTLNGEVVKPEGVKNCLVIAAFSSFLIGGIVNVFLTLKVIKEAMRLSHWPAAAVVLMTLLFPLEVIVGALLVIPNIIIFGLNGRKENRVYEVEY